MTPEEKRLKEINHRQWEIEENIKALKKESQLLRNELLQIRGYHKIEQCKKAYSKGKGRNGRNLKKS